MTRHSELSGVSDTYTLDMSVTRSAKICSGRNTSQKVTRSSGMSGGTVGSLFNGGLQSAEAENPRSSQHRKITLTDLSELLPNY